MTARIKLKVAPKGAGGNSPKKKVSKKRTVGRKHPDREGEFALLWENLAVDWEIPQRQFKFDPERKWRFDFAWPYVKVAVEIDGGVFQAQATGHRSIDGIVSSMEKSNAAAMQGWCLLRYHANDLDQRPAQVVAMVQSAILIRRIDNNTAKVKELLKS